jgi:hypothetical protein
MNALLTLPSSFRNAVLISGLAAMAGSASCGLADTASPVATPRVELNRDRVPLGGPLDLTYRFTVAQDAAPLDSDYVVFVHFLDADGELMFTDDHEPPQATSSWQPGQEISYDRRMTVPVYPYIGEVTVAVGLYSPTAGDRVPMAGEHLGQRAYAVATLQMAPQSESGFVMYENGWHAAESAPESPDREWRWTTGQSTIAFRNPRSDSTLYLEVDGRPELFEAPQVLTLSVGDSVTHTNSSNYQLIDTIGLEAIEPSFHVIPIPAAILGDADTVTLTLTVDPPFVPSEATDGANSDSRELGMQVFYAFLEKK